MRRRGLDRRQAMLFLAVFILGSLYYFFGGDPCPFHHDRPADAMSRQSGHTQSLCLCAWSAVDLPAVPFMLSRIDFLGFCPAERIHRPADIFVQDISHPPQPSSF